MEQIKKFILKGDKLVKKTFQNLKMIKKKKMIIINIKELKKKKILKKKFKVIMKIQGLINIYNL